MQLSPVMRFSCGEARLLQSSLCGTALEDCMKTAASEECSHQGAGGGKTNGLYSTYAAVVAVSFPVQCKVLGLVFKVLSNLGPVYFRVCLLS